ncbi:hypothetical protein CPLU01_13154, partial [Colletotrichum plurivorum]
MDAKLRAFAANLSGDRSYNDELTELQRVAITAVVLSGTSQRVAARLFNCSRGAIEQTLRRYEKDGNFVSNPRQGRPSVLSRQQKRAV